MDTKYNFYSNSLIQTLRIEFDNIKLIFNNEYCVLNEKISNFSMEVIKNRRSYKNDCVLFWLCLNEFSLTEDKIFLDRYKFIILKKEY